MHANTGYTLSFWQRFYYYIKNILDRLLSLAGLVLFALPMVLLAIAIKLDDQGPVLFKQTRIGKDRTTFTMLKFRSMRMDTPHDVATHLLTEPYRHITRVGKFLRKTSLDELPQLFNILLGHMSLVGPRPALWNQFDLIEERERYGVHQLRPGLTGWAQVNGRDELEIPVKARLDGEYLEHFGLAMDIRCLLATLSILSGRGVMEGPHDPPDQESAQ